MRKGKEMKKSMNEMRTQMSINTECSDCFINGFDAGAQAMREKILGILREMPSSVIPVETFELIETELEKEK